jgi:hypothetical protein
MSCRRTEILPECCINSIPLCFILLLCDRLTCYCHFNPNSNLASILSEYPLPLERSARHLAYLKGLARPFGTPHQIFELTNLL